MAVNDVVRRMNMIIDKLDEKIDLSMYKVGEDFVENARKAVTQSIYERITGRTPNREHWELTGKLRNSIQYNRKTSGDERSLVLSAGAEYAAAVESRGYDVISGSLPQAEKDFAIYFNRAMKAAIRDISKK